MSFWVICSHFWVICSHFVTLLTTDYYTTRQNSQSIRTDDWNRKCSICIGPWYTKGLFSPTYVQFSSVQFNSVQFSLIQFNSAPENAFTLTYHYLFQFNSVQFDSVQLFYTEENRPQFGPFNIYRFKEVMHHTIKKLRHQQNEKAFQKDFELILVTVLGKILPHQFFFFFDKENNLRLTP